MIYLVDNTLDGNGASPREIAAALGRIAPDVELVVEHHGRVTPARVDQLGPSHIILSGQSHPWTMYSPDSLAGVFGVIRGAQQPVLGVCGGHQQIALCYGATVGLIRRIAPGVGYEGAFREHGFVDVELCGDGLFAGLPDRFAAWASHCDEVKELPQGFELAASNTTSPIQAMRHASRPLFGVQFHPELFDDEHPQGRLVLEGFLAL
jgi:GMP synthase-like glutamine amidotransferase